MRNGPIADPKLAALEQLARWHFSSAALPGAVLHVVTADGPVLTVEYGDLSADTPVVLGSTSKSVTAALLLQFVDDGRLSLDDPARKHLTNVALPDDVTLRDLACHVSGLRTDATPRHLAQKRDREFAYSNQNYNLLGDVLTTVSGANFGILLSEGLLQPLGMSQTGCAPETTGARGWSSLFGRDVPAPRADFGPGSWIQAPSGGVVTSARDAGRLLSMILSGGTAHGRQVLSPQSIETMLSAGVEVKGSPAVSDALGDSGRYGFGWVTKEVNGHIVHLHSGKVPQSTSVFALIPELGVGFVLLADIGDFLVRTPLLEDLGSAIIRELFNLPPRESQSPTKARDRQRVLNVAYGAFIAAGILGWFPRTRPRSVPASVLYHGAIPATLVMGARKASHTPWPWLVRFAPDAAAVLAVGCLSMGLTGVARIARHRRAS